MNKKIEDTVEWLNELEKYMQEQKFPMRMQDSIGECRKSLQEDNINWNKVNTLVDEVLESIKVKTEKKEIVRDEKRNEASIQTVKEHVRKMVERCHMENVSSVAALAERKSLIIKKTCRRMNEISHTEAHLEEMKKTDSYVAFFEKIRNEYDSEVNKIGKEFVDDIGNNFEHMMEYLKRTFQSIRGYKIGVGSKKFFYESESQIRMGNTVLQEMEVIDSGSENIIEFAQKTKDIIKDKVKKIQRKKKFLAWLPFIVLFLFLVVQSMITRDKNEAILEKVQAESVQTENGEDKGIDIDELKEIVEIGQSVIQITQKIGISKLGEIFSSVLNFSVSLLVSLGAALIIVLLLIIALYMLYLKKLKKWCNQRIARECGEYLQTELHRYEKENHMLLRMNEMFEKALQEYEQQYMNVLDRIFEDTKLDENSENANGAETFFGLYDGWQRLKYE